MQKNDREQVVGGSMQGNGHAFFWQNGPMTDLGTLVLQRDFGRLG